MSGDRDRDSASQASDDDDDDGWFEIHEVIAERSSRRNKKKKEYCVSWTPNPTTGETYEPTWVPRDDLTESAFDAWQHIKKEKGQKEKQKKARRKPRQSLAQRTGTSSERKEDEGTTDSSQPVIPADQRRRIYHQISPTPDLSISPVSKGTRPFSTSNSDLDEPDSVHAPATATARAIFAVEINKREDFDASQYWSVSDSQTTAELSQPISTLESEDAQIFLVNERIIPDSQEWDSAHHTQSQQQQIQRDELPQQQQPQNGEHQTPKDKQQQQSQPQNKERQTQKDKQPQQQPIEIPDSQEPSSLESQQTSAPISFLSLVVAEDTSCGPSLPSRQPDIILEPAVQTQSISSASGSSQAQAQVQTSERIRVRPSTLLAQFVSQQLSEFPASSSTESEPVASPLTIQPPSQTLSTPSQAFQTSPSAPTPSQAAQVILASSPLIEPPRPAISSQGGDSVIPDSVERASERSKVWPISPLEQRPRLSARSVLLSFLDETDQFLPSSPLPVANTMGDPSPNKQSARDLLRMALDPSLSGSMDMDNAPAQTDSETAGAIRTEIQSSIPDPLLNLELTATTATLEQPSIQINSPPRLTNDPILSAHTQPPTPSDVGIVHDPPSLINPLHLNSSDATGALGSFLGADNSAEPFPTTVSPSEISRSIEPDLPPLDLTADAMDIGLNDAELENALPGSPHSQDDDVDAEMTTEPSDFVVTLQLPANIKELYVDTYNHEKPVIEQFTALQLNGKFVEASLVAKVDELMDRLFRICDLPGTLSKDSILQLSAKDIAKHAMGTNSKLCFVGRVLDKLTTANKKKVLVVARSQELIGYLEAIVASIGDIAYSKTNFDDVRVNDAQADNETGSGLAVVLARADQHVKDLDEFDVVIAYDTSYPSSKVAAGLQTSDDYPADKKRPVVLTLVNTYTIEHFDLAIAKDINSLERQSAMLYALFTSRAYLLHFEDELTVEATASLFAEHILEQDLITLAESWRPQEVPQIFLEYFESSQHSQSGNDTANKPDADDQVEEGKSLTEGVANEVLVADSSVIPDAGTRKRKLEEDTEDEGSKRPRGPESPNTELENINEVVHSQVLSQPADFQGSKSELESYKALIASLESQLKEKVDTEAVMRKQITRMSTQIKSHDKSTNTIQRRLMEALLERATALDTAKKAEEQAQAMAADLQKSADNYVALESKYNSLMDAHGSEDKTFALLTSTEKKLGEAEAKISSLEQKLKSKDSELEYVRDTFQTERQASSQTMRENEELRTQVTKLRAEQSANRVKIQQINATNNTTELARLVTEAQIIARDREMELDRVKEELRLVKNGRRETRGASVPRSPRMGMMSPRTGRGGVVATGPGASRGTSPAHGGIDGQTGAPPSVPGAQFFIPPSSNGRYNHLRDFV
ncbi:hypothetical protein F5X68DRAFT_203907 [Plectosphaerella plurivora]|uniref:Chromo domain-containing protein n=1 Tax=Plectosphaerella plurivora TaxID=936078 RepID=A0A9P9ACH9_9PEZI|nr:hypothetical protein F5X68DRAFT_203907 [Plectosphaerella plurivora]